MWPHNPRTKHVKEVLDNKELMGGLRTAVCHFHNSCALGMLA